MPNSQHKLIYEFSGSRNLNTSPLDVTGLDGDNWDYMVEFTADQNTTYSFFQMTMNNDTTANYREYYMQGRKAVGSAGVTETSSSMLFGETGNTGGQGNLARCKISGDSSNERYADWFWSDQRDAGLGDTGLTKVAKYSSYWKNTSNNLTSLQFKNGISLTFNITLRVYQVPKQANLENYDLVEKVDFSARDLNANPIVFSGLNGDSDGEYFVECDTDRIVRMRLNSDSGSNYPQQWLRNDGGTISANNLTFSAVYPDASNQALGGTIKTVFSLDAQSGRKRLVKATMGYAPSTEGYEQVETACWWSNTVDNITSISLLDTVATSATGTVKLYRRKSNKTIDPVPMTTVVEYDIAGVDFSAGITISGIEGDRIDGAIKVEFVGEGNVNVVAQLNADTGSNYTYQSLVGVGSSVVASSTTIGNILFSPNGAGVNRSEFWIYPQSGQNRPILTKSYQNENTIQYRANWWNNSVDEITSMKIFAEAVTSITGTIKISIPKGTKQAANSWALVVN